MSLLDSLFRRDKTAKNAPPATSSSVAKERLQLALVYDRVKVSPELMQTIKEEIIGVISKHFDVDSSGIEITFGDGNSHLIANIPVRRSREFNRS
jgi:cell division topological specificity factor